MTALARAYADRAEATLAADETRVVLADHSIGLLLLERGELSRARRHLEACSLTSHRRGDAATAAAIDVDLARVWRELGEVARARTTLLDAYATFAAREDHAGLARCDELLVDVELDRQRGDLAEQALERLDGAADDSRVEVLRARVFAARGHPGAALRLLEALAENTDLSDRLAAQVRILTAEVRIELGSPEVAVDDLRRMLGDNGDALSRERAELELALGDAELAAGDVQTGLVHIDAARTAFTRLGLDLRVATCLLRRGWARGARSEDAARDFGHALRLFGLYGSDRGIAAAESGLATVHSASGEITEAELRWARAQAGFLRAGLPGEAAWCAVARARAALAQAEAEGVSDQERDRWLGVARRRLVPAVLHILAGRYELESSADRVRWQSRVAGAAAEEALRLALRTGDTRLTAALIVAFRASGTMTLDPDARRDPRRPAPIPSGSGVVRLLGRESLRLDPPPCVGLPAGGLAALQDLARATQEFGRMIVQATAVAL